MYSKKTVQKPDFELLNIVDVCTPVSPKELVFPSAISVPVVPIVPEPVAAVVPIVPEPVAAVVPIVPEPVAAVVPIVPEPVAAVVPIVPEPVAAVVPQEPVASFCPPEPVALVFPIGPQEKVVPDSPLDLSGDSYEGMPPDVDLYEDIIFLDNIDFPSRQ
jgi:hypothetical protein